MNSAKQFFSEGMAQLDTSIPLLWFAVFPLCSGNYSHMTQSKWHSMILFGVLSCLLCFFSLIRQKKLPAVSCTGAQKSRMLTVFLLLGGYLLWLCLSCLFGQLHAQKNEQEQFIVLWGLFRHEGLFTSLMYTLIFLCSLTVHPRTRLLSWGASVSLLLTFSVAALQYLGINPLGLYPAGYNIFTNYEFQSTFGNIDILASYLSLIIPFLLGAWMLESRGGFFLFSALSGILWLLCTEVQSGQVVLVFTGLILLFLALCSARFRSKALASLSGLCAMIYLRNSLHLPWLDSSDHLSFILSPLDLWTLFAILFLCGSLLCIKHPGKDIPWKILISLFLFMILLAFFAFLNLELSPSSGGAWELQQVLKGHILNSFGSYRAAVWKHCMHLAAESPLFGFGPGTFYYALQTHLRSEGIFLPESFDHPHNLFLGELMDGGYPLAALWFALMACLVISCLRKGGWSAIFSFSMLGYLIQGVFLFPSCAVTPLFWAMAGLGVSSLR